MAASQRLRRSRTGGKGPRLEPSLILFTRYRADYVQQLYGDLGPPCRLCGRRFKEDEQGRNKKTAHLDWHFRVNQRIAEAEKKGQHRSWYVTAEVRLLCHATRLPRPPDARVYVREWNLTSS